MSVKCILQGCLTDKEWRIGLLEELSKEIPKQLPK